MRKPKLPKRPINKATKRDERRKTHKKKYKVRNWKEYNESLVRRGSLEFWIEKGLIKSWKVEIIDEKGERKRGSHEQYSDNAIELCRLVGKVFHQRLRQTEGFIRSVFTMTDMRLEVPDYSTLSRRGGTIAVNLPRQNKGNVVAILDSTGFKVYGEGEWKVRKHGYSKRRTWMKAHISIDKDGEIRAVRLTDNSVDDAHAGEELLEKQGCDRIEEVDADGAYDKRKFYAACQKKRISHIVIPPRKGGKIWFHRNRKSEPHPRDENIRAIRRSTRNRWKQESGYHKRSKVETTMFRAKTIFGEKLYSRNIDNQKTEVILMAKALNLMLYNGIPESFAVT